MRKRNEGNKDRTLRDIKNLFEHEDENYYKPVRNKTLSVEEYFDKITPYFKDIIKNHKKSDIWKIQLNSK